MSPSSLDPRRVRPYRRRARGIVFAAVLFVVAGIGGLASPEDVGRSVVARELDRALQIAWFALYAGGGILVIVGVYWPRCPRPELEVLGLWPLLAGASINLLAIVMRGLTPGTLTTLGLLCLAIWTLHGRALDLDEARHAERRYGPRPYRGPDRRRRR